MQDKEIRTWPLALGPGGKVTLEADAAAIQVLPVPAGETPRLELPEAMGEMVDMEVEQKDNAVSVTMSHRNLTLRPGKWLDWFKSHRGGLKVYLPEDLTIEVEAQAGKVTVANLRVRRLDVRAEAGAIILYHVSGDLKLKATAGKIDGEALSGALDVSSTSGAVRLGIVTLNPGRHTVEAEVGSIQIELPKGAPVEVRAEAKIGTLNNGFTSMPSAPAKLEVTANVGSVRIRTGYPTDAAPVTSAAPATLIAGAVAVAAPPENELARVLKMVEDGSLSAEDAAELLKALEGR